MAIGAQDGGRSQATGQQGAKTKTFEGGDKTQGENDRDLAAVIITV